MKKKPPLVSVNIPTYNSARTLTKALESVAKQTYPRVEVVVADGHSQDKTLKIAKKYKAKVYYAQELGRARFEAFSKSHGDYVLFFDSDQILKSDLIEKCVNKCEKGGFDALTILEKSLITKGTLVEKLIAYDKYVIDSLKDDDVVCGDAVPRFFRTKILQNIVWPKELSVFDHTGIFLEVVKKGAKIGYLSTSCILHHEVDSWTKFFKKFYRYGFYYFEALKDYPKPVIAHSLPRRSYFTRAAMSKPTYFLGLLLLYAVKGIAASFGVISYFFHRGGKK